MDDSLITVKEVADYLKLKEQTVYLLARQNKIPSLKVGGSLRFKKSQMDNWLATTPKTSGQETRQRVLIVDDEDLVRETLKRMVEAHDIQTVAVSNGAQAVKAAQEESFRMVFLDLSMPGMNGVETLKALKDIDRDLVFVVVTGLTGEDDLFRSVLDHAPVSVVPKPFTMQQIGGVLSLYFEDVKEVNYAQAQM
ncbi:MAG: response regulator [Acidobacteria bacterium]|nr:response regulator [Acidobacteriota bacterium]